MYTGEVERGESQSGKPSATKAGVHGVYRVSRFGETQPGGISSGEDERGRAKDGCHAGPGSPPREGGEWRGRGDCSPGVCCGAEVLHETGTNRVATNCTYMYSPVHTYNVLVG